MKFDFSSWPPPSATRRTQLLLETSGSFPQGTLGSAPAAELWLPPGPSWPFSPALFIPPSPMNCAETLTKPQRLRDRRQPKQQTTFLWDHGATMPEVRRTDPEDVAWWLVCSAFLEALQHLENFPMGTIILASVVHLMILFEFKLVWADIFSKRKDRRKQILWVINTFVGCDRWKI